MLYLSPIALVLVVYIAHLVRKRWLRRKVAEWAKHRTRLTDDAFFIALNSSSITRDAAISVRAMVSDAVRIPRELIAPNDIVSELERVGDPSHPSTVSYFEDMWSVISPKDDSRLLTVREFASKTK